jgi:hypothetical protein
LHFQARTSFPWQFGDKEKAGKWFAKAVQWTANGIKDYEEPKRIQKEAAEMLGIEKRESGDKGQESDKKPQPTGSGDGQLLNLINGTARVAGNEALVLAIDQQVEGFENNCADQRGRVLRFDDGTKSAMSAEQLEEHRIGLAALGPPTIGVTHFDLVARWQTQLFGDSFGQYKHRRPRVDDPFDRLPPNLIPWYHAVFCQGQVFVVGNFELNTESAHFVGSSQSHGHDVVSRRTSNRSEAIVTGIGDQAT